MKIMITGGRGMLGRTLQKELSEHDLIIADLPECDITDYAKLADFTRAAQPDAMIHCAAMTAVDRCETEQDLAYKLNETGSANVAKVCAEDKIRLIAISTDYVFAGDLDRPYNEYDQANGGKTVYGQSKFAGEEAIRKYCPAALIGRISWLYGAGGPSFVHTMMKLADGTRPQLKVVNDQIGNPTSTTAVARKLKELLARPELTGVFHLTCEGEASWFDLACEVFRLTGKNQTVLPCSSEEFGNKTPRPKNSRLEKRRLQENGLAPMPDWHDALKEFVQSEFK